MKRALLLIMLLVPVMAGTTYAEVTMDGFVQGLFGGGLDSDNPTSTDYTANETRLQLRTEHYGDAAEVFGRIDFVWDGADSSKYELELREAYIKFQLGLNLDFKVGRQILTWGTADLLFINDVFVKDYRSFFVGRDDQYLKAPQTAIRFSWYNTLGELAVAYTPRFEANRLPRGQVLSYYQPTAGQIVGTGLNGDSASFLLDVPVPEATFKNGEIAMRWSRQVGYFNLAGYFYHGFYKNPRGMVVLPDSSFMPVYPRLNLYGASIRGQYAGGILWLEGGYYDSRDDQDGDDPMMPNSSVTGLIGYERQVATDLTMNAQWQVDKLSDYASYEADQVLMDAYVRDEVYHLLTSRMTKLLLQETLTLSGFVFYSPTDEDVYVRASVEYKQSDELTLAVGANIFDGTYSATEFGQLEKNDNAYLKVTYGF